METDIPKIRFLGSFAAAGGCVCNIHAWMNGFTTVPQYQ